MERGLASRLNLKPGMRVVLCNDQIKLADALRAELGAGVEEDAVAGAAGGKVAAVLFFAADSRTLEGQYAIVKPLLHAATMLWVAYPKKSSGVKTDLTRDDGWQMITADGWQSVRQIALSDVWSAVRYKQVADARMRGSVDEQYGGPRAHLRPIHDKVALAIAGLGPDVSPPYVRGAYVAWSRRNHFVAVGPVGRNAVGVAFKFRDEAMGERMVAGNKIGGGAFTHFVPLASTDDVDAALLALLQRAYDASA